MTYLKAVVIEIILTRRKKVGIFNCLRTLIHQQYAMQLFGENQRISELSLLNFRVSAFSKTKTVIVTPDFPPNSRQSNFRQLCVSTPECGWLIEALLNFCSKIPTFTLCRKNHVKVFVAVFPRLHVTRIHSSSFIRTIL